MADKDILTTADTARLLGVSVRTAQLLIEGGAVPSWKTPGGHRRVYRSDVETIITGEPVAVERAAARIVVVASGDMGRSLETLFASVGECQAEVHGDVHSALMAIGAIRPRIILVHLDSAAPDRDALVETLLGDHEAGSPQVVLLQPGLAEPVDETSDRPVRVVTASAAVAAIRGLLADPKSDPNSAQNSAMQMGEDLPFPIALNEAQRLVALERSGLVDTGPEEPFDRIAWLAAHTLDTSIALISLLTPTRQFFKARLGLDMVDTPRSIAFCNYTILQKEIFSVEDLRNDPRFSSNPTVEGEPGFRFYAGAPIFDAAGFALGTLCVIDFKPRKLDALQKRTLAELAALASLELRFRDTDRRLRELLRDGGRPARPPSTR